MKNKVKQFHKAYVLFHRPVCCSSFNVDPNMIKGYQRQWSKWKLLPTAGFTTIVPCSETWPENDSDFRIFRSGVSDCQWFFSVKLLGDPLQTLTPVNTLVDKNLWKENLRFDSPKHSIDLSKLQIHLWITWLKLAQIDRVVWGTFKRLTMHTMLPNSSNGFKWKMGENFIEIVFYNQILPTSLGGLKGDLVTSSGKIASSRLIKSPTHDQTVPLLGSVTPASSSTLEMFEPNVFSTELHASRHLFWRTAYNSRTQS